MDPKKESTSGPLGRLIERLLDVRPVERGPVAWSMVFALLSVASAIVARAVSDALFLTSFPLSDVPTFFIVSNGIFIVGSLVYSAMVRTVRPVRLNVSILIFFALSMLAARLAIPPDGAVGPIFAISVWLTVATPLLNILAWNTIVDRFDSRQGRRLFPIIFAASTLGAILAGVAIGPFIGVFGLDNLLYVLGGLVAFTVPLPMLLNPPAGRSDHPSRSVIIESSGRLWEIFKEGITAVGSSRLLRTVAAIVFLAALVTNVVDFAFKGVLQAAYTKDEIGAFYGAFHAVANTANLGLQLFVVAWAIDRLGIGRVFRVLPVALLAGTVMLGWLPGFITIVGLKFVDGLLRFTFQNAANEVAIAPIPYVQRNRAKILIKGAMNPLGAIAAGLLLIPFASADVLPVPYLVGVLLVGLLLWLWLVGRIGQTYAEQLYTSLRQKQAARTPIPEEGELFGGVTTGSGAVMASSARWSALEEPEPEARPVLVIEPLDGNVPNGLDDVGEFRAFSKSHPRRDFAGAISEGVGIEGPSALGITDDSPVVRTTTLEQLVAAVRHGAPLPCGVEVLEGLLWRELNVAFAVLQRQHGLAGNAGRRARRAHALLGARLDDGIYRVFLLLGLLGDVQTARAAYLGWRFETGRTRAHAVDLVDAILDGAPYQRAIMALLEDRDLGTRLARALRLSELDPEAFSDPDTVLAGEDDPQLRRLLEKVAA